MKIATATIYDAEKLGLIRLTNWLVATNAEKAYLFKEHQRITSDPTRQALIVGYMGRLALFVNDIAHGPEVDHLDDYMIG